MCDCFFCKRLQERDRIVLENELAFAVYDEFPVNRGHMLFMTKRHAENFFTITNAERTAIFELIDIAKPLIDETYHPDGYNIGMNCGEAAGQSVMHVHTHLIPRYNGDVENPRGGVRGVIPKNQNY